MPREYTSIVDYRPLPGDDAVYNPYLREVMDILTRCRAAEAPDIASALLENRTELVSKYAFSIPIIEALEVLASLSPLVEIGAGTGYWAMCLTELGADIIALDNRIPGDHDPWDWRSANPWHDHTWFPVEEGDEETAGLYPERTLLLCWPPPESPMAINALRRYLDAGGTRVAFVGSTASAGDERFHVLRNSLSLERRLRLPGWPWIDEILAVHRR